eukprot:1358616-Pleurochrysis_carterae.AAC.1
MQRVCESLPGKQSQAGTVGTHTGRFCPGIYPQVPASHGVGSVAPAAHAWPGGHGVHCCKLLKPVSLLNVPEGQSR